MNAREDERRKFLIKIAKERDRIADRDMPRAASLEQYVQDRKKFSGVELPSADEAALEQAELPKPSDDLEEERVKLLKSPVFAGKEMSNLELDHKASAMKRLREIQAKRRKK